MRKLVFVATMVLAAATLPAFEVGDTPAVSVRTGEIRRSPAFLAPVASEVEYGQTVEVLEVGAGWVRVKVLDTNQEGWIHESAIASKEALRLELAEGASGDTTRMASSREIALAGRGFNEQVEQQYQSEKGLDFTEVDRMETMEIGIEVIGEFFAAADLGPEVTE